MKTAGLMLAHYNIALAEVHRMDKSTLIIDLQLDKWIL